MKCEVCLELLEEYLDGELPANDREHVDEHVSECADCSGAFAALTTEQELFARYDREIEVPPFLWTRIAANSFSEKDSISVWVDRLLGIFGTGAGSVAASIAVVLIALLIAYGLLSDPSVYREMAGKNTIPPSPRKVNTPIPAPSPQKIEDNTGVVTSNSNPPKPKRRVKPTSNRIPATIDQSDVLSSDLGYLDMDDQDTAKHIEQTENLLRSIRNVSVTDGDDEIDVSYDKALSRRLLNENVVLRRDAEMKAKFPTKTLLADLEPFLLDIANLPDRARPEEVRAIKERVQKTEIVAALMGYQERGTNNR